MRINSNLHALVRANFSTVRRSSMKNNFSLYCSSIWIPWRKDENDRIQISFLQVRSYPNRKKMNFEIYQLAGSRRSLIFFKSSMQPRWGNISRACRRKYGKRSVTCPLIGWNENQGKQLETNLIKPAPEWISLKTRCKSTGRIVDWMQNFRKLTNASWKRRTSRPCSSESFLTSSRR